MGFTGISRISDLMRTNTLVNTLRRTNLQMGLLQQQLATGNRLLAPSVDPPAADASFSLQRQIEQQEQLLANIQGASRIFATADTQLGDAAELVREAITLAQANLDSGVDQTSRQTIANRIGELSRSLLDIANTRVGDVYVFGGTANTAAPFLSAGASIRYAGRTDAIQGMLGGSDVTAMGVTGDEAFGALSSQVAGYQDLRPAMGLTTRLADLDGASGDGIRLGTIVLRDNAVNLAVDLAGCDSVGDVIDRINDAGGAAITAGIAPGGQRLAIVSAAGGLTVTEQGAARAAHDLGIYRNTDQGLGFLGDSVDPRVTLTTALADLAAGAGIDQTSGLLITNGGASEAVDLSAAVTVQDLLNAINSADVGVWARINAAGSGLDIVNALSGSELRIGENGGTTAEQLGVRSLHAATLLADLNGGAGVRQIQGEPDFRITACDGAAVDVDLDSARTVQDVIDRINAAAGPGVTAALAATGNGIVLTDTTGGPGNLTISAINASDAAADLGIAGAAAGAVLTGQDRNPITPGGVFAHLAQLADVLGRDGMDVNERTAAVNRIAAALGEDQDHLVALRARMGGLVASLENRQERTEDQKIASSDLLSTLKDTDLTEAISRFEALQAALQGNLITASRILGTSLLDFLA